MSRFGASLGLIATAWAVTLAAWIWGLNHLTVTPARRSDSHLTAVLNASTAEASRNFEKTLELAAARLAVERRGDVSVGEATPVALATDAVLAQVGADLRGSDDRVGTVIERRFAALEGSRWPERRALFDLAVSLDGTLAPLALRMAEQIVALPAATGEQVVARRLRADAAQWLKQRSGGAR